MHRSMHVCIHLCTRSTHTRSTHTRSTHTRSARTKHTHEAHARSTRTKHTHQAHTHQAQTHEAHARSTRTKHTHEAHTHEARTHEARTKHARSTHEAHTHQAHARSTRTKHTHLRARVECWNAPRFSWATGEEAVVKLLDNTARDDCKMSVLWSVVSAREGPLHGRLLFCAPERQAAHHVRRRRPETSHSRCFRFLPHFAVLGAFGLASIGCEQPNTCTRGARLDPTNIETCGHISGRCACKTTF